MDEYCLSAPAEGGGGGYGLYLPHILYRFYSIQNLVLFILPNSSQLICIPDDGRTKTKIFRIKTCEPFTYQEPDRHSRAPPVRHLQEKYNHLAATDNIASSAVINQAAVTRVHIDKF
jgi:hypothetical protein